MGPSQAGWAAVTGTTLGHWGQADVTSVNYVLTCHLGLGPRRQVAGINVFCTIGEEHSAAVGLHGGSSGSGPGKRSHKKTKMSPSL